MTATYTFDVFSSLDGFGAATGNWAGYWGKQGPELLAHREAQYAENQRLVLGANTYRAFAEMLAAGEPDTEDAWGILLWNLPTTVISNTLKDPLDWPNATLARGDAV